MDWGDNLYLFPHGLSVQIFLQMQRDHVKENTFRRVDSQPFCNSWRLGVPLQQNILEWNSSPRRKGPKGTVKGIEARVTLLSFWGWKGEVSLAIKEQELCQLLNHCWYLFLLVCSTICKSSLFLTSFFLYVIWDLGDGMKWNRGLLGIPNEFLFRKGCWTDVDCPSINCWDPVNLLVNSPFSPALCLGLRPTPIPLRWSLAQGAGTKKERVRDDSPIRYQGWVYLSGRNLQTLRANKEELDCWLASVWSLVPSLFPMPSLFHHLSSSFKWWKGKAWE